MAPDSASAAPPLSTPVAFFVFNRPALTRQVLARLREARPTRLFVIADGPRPKITGEALVCEEVRTLVLQGIDWPCQVLTLFSPTNLGCGPRLYSGLQWLFQHVEEAIILEDDCLPHPTFFRFCAEMLAEYRDHPAIFMVAGTHFGGAQPDQANRCLFTRHCSVWGWATWRRAIANYSLDMSWWRREVQPRDIRRECADGREYRFICDLFDAPRHGAVNTWDIQWFAHVFRHRGFSVVPGTNLVSNLGITGQHTTKSATRHHLASGAAQFPIVPPPKIERDRDYERLLVHQHRPPGGWFLGHYLTRLVHGPCGPVLRHAWRRCRMAVNALHQANSQA